MSLRMTRSAALGAVAAFGLAACGDPLRGVDRLSSVELAEEAPAVSVAAASDDAAAAGGFLSGLLGRNAAPEPSQTDAAVTAALGDAIEEGDGVGAENVAVAVEPAAPAPRRGLFGFLRGASDAPATVAPEAEGSVEIASAPVSDVAEATDGLVDEAKIAAVTDTAPLAEARPRRGLFGLLTGARAKADEDAGTEELRTASLTPQPQSQPKRSRVGNGPDALEVSAGTQLPSGAIARVCDISKRQMGKEVGRFPERGNGYRMYDSAPRATGPRPFYVTGFKDGCARTFTAALALFGSPSMHEQLRYGLPAKETPYSTTDKAYENIKVAVCKVSRRKPCGSKVTLLEKDTAFISIYDRIGSNSSWSNVLLHRGTVLAADRKG